MIKAVKGTRDILPPSSAVWNQVEAITRELFRTFNYQEIRTPIIEETALFARGVLIGADRRGDDDGKRASRQAEPDHPRNFGANHFSILN